MVRGFRTCDLPAVMQIWLETNMEAHRFIPKEYWMSQWKMVSESMLKAEVYVYEDEDDADGRIGGFIGLMDDYVAGLFVKRSARSKGIGKQLLDHVKGIKSSLCLHAYQKNVGAIRFYRREAFQVRAEDMDSHTNEKEFFMTWDRASSIPEK